MYNHVAANQSVGYTAKFEKIGGNEVVALKSGLVETGGGYGPAQATCTCKWK